KRASCSRTPCSSPGPTAPGWRPSTTPSWRGRRWKKRPEARYSKGMILALILAVVQSGSATAAVQHAQEKIRKDLNVWFKAEGPAKQKARDQARAAVGELIDFDTLAKSTLGSKWDQISPRGRARYNQALRGAMEASYLSKMRQGKTQDVDKVKSEVLGEEQQEGKTVVKTRVVSGDDTASIDYIMEKEKKGWRAVDVLTEGVSLAETYRDQVTKMMAKKDLNAVISALDKKRKALEAE